MGDFLKMENEIRRRETKSKGANRKSDGGCQARFVAWVLGLRFLNYALKTSSYRPACNFETVFAVATVAK